MGQFGIVSELFRSVTNGMPEIENHAQAGIMLVDGDHIALDFNALVNYVPNMRFIVRLRYHFQNRGIGDITVFDNLGHAVGKGGIR